MHLTCILTSPLKGFLLELGRPTGVRGQKNYNDGTTWPRKKFDAIFSCLDTIHERDRQTDGQTDGQTPVDSKDHANAYIASRGNKARQYFLQ